MLGGLSSVPTRVVDKIWQVCRYGWEGYRCENDLNKGIFYRRTKVQNTGELVFFLCRLGEDVKGAFLKECAASYLRLASRVVNKIWKGCRYGCEG